MHSDARPAPSTPASESRSERLEEIASYMEQLENFEDAAFIRSITVSERLASGFSKQTVDDVRGWIKANIDAEKDEGTQEAVRLLEKIDAMLCER